MSWGKHFSSMYEGSMVGKGACFFAVWGYVISHYVPDPKGVCRVELNPKIIAFLIGEPEKEVRRVIEQFCEPDAESRTKECDGRKLIKTGEFSYEVVNGAKYRAIRDEEDRKEQNRIAQEKFRKRQKILKSGKPLPGETRAVAAEKNGASPEQVARIATEHLPVPAGAPAEYSTGDEHEPVNEGS